VYGKGRGEFVLPCGFVTPDAKVHKKIVLRETKGHEEDMMDDDSVLRSTRITNVLSSCIEQLGPVTDKEQIRLIVSDEMQGVGKGITSTDRIASMIFLRRTSVGDVYNFERRCPRIGCGHLNKNKTLDLRTIKMTTIPEERVGKRRVQFQLPRSGKLATLRVMTAKHEESLLKLRPTQKDLRSAAMCARVEAIGDETFTNPEKAMAAVKDLPQADRNAIREVYDKIEADVDTTIQVQCDNPICQAEFEFPLDIGQTFFSNLAGAGAASEKLTWL
jgi:hypothetical protein